MNSSAASRVTAVGRAARGTTAPLSTARGHRCDHLSRLDLEHLSLTTHIETHEMAKMGKLNLTTELQLEGQGPEAIRPGLLTNLDNDLGGFRLCVDELSPDRKVIVPFRQLVNG